MDEYFCALYFLWKKNYFWNNWLSANLLTVGWEKDILWHTICEETCIWNLSSEELSYSELLMSIFMRHFFEKIKYSYITHHKLKVEHSIKHTQNKNSSITINLTIN